MLTFTTFFLISIVLALIAVFIYKVVADTRKAIKKSKQRIDMVGRAPTHQREYATRLAVSGTQGNSDFWGTAKSHPAAPNEYAVSKSQGFGDRYPLQRPRQGKGAADISSRCSLYDVSIEEPTLLRETGGEHYKVTRRAVAKTTEDQSPG